MTKTNKMEKFKVKVGDFWIFEFNKTTIAGIDDESSAKVFNTDNIEYVQNEIGSRFKSEIIEFVPVRDEKQPESKPKELDLCEILKDAPIGLKLWSLVYGDVEFERISNSHTFAVVFSPVDEKHNSGGVKSNGKIGDFGECTIFPSKENRDWSTFKLPYKLPVKGELCWTMSSVGNYVPRFATGESALNRKVFFFDDQDCKGIARPYIWQPLSEVPEVLKNHLKLK